VVDYCRTEIISVYFPRMEVILHLYKIDTKAVEVHGKKNLDLPECFLVTYFISKRYIDDF
jgi:hypothetical protein